ncbi:hypothetical protein BJP34_19180 [Moorena producens PAL-8-15-08-1]|uniref:Uncharacterized protein n=1 Tax=Moorena producens PAL-8-15-08-1 TaxID=1458985 RepID=A0A1D8TUH7_9CYAN|nr:hypothetical protein [Moorena producens]AOX01277.1 hypothetical protein BJP34_19180 [Moorena producens PAL-8-15-08-1]
MAEVDEAGATATDSIATRLGELIKNPTRKLTPQQQLEILNTHPFFTGKCPECGYNYDKNNPPAVHWDCPECGWIDDAIH